MSLTWGRSRCQDTVSTVVVDQDVVFSLCMPVDRNSYRCCCCCCCSPDTAGFCSAECFAGRGDVLANTLVLTVPPFSFSPQTIVHDRQAVGIRVSHLPPTAAVTTSSVFRVALESDSKSVDLGIREESGQPRMQYFNMCQ